VSTTKKRHTGLTLLETMLVLAIASLLILLGLRQYQTYLLDAQIQQVKANVDTIMQGMLFFYRAQCYGTVNTSTGILAPGKLNPQSFLNFNVPSIFPINIPSDLVTPGYLTTVVPLNPIVDSSQPGTYEGYVAQFNLEQSTKYVCTSAQTNAVAFGPNDPTCATKIGTIINWNIQVAVALKDTAQAQTYLSLLQGNCLSSINGVTVTPCSGGTGSGSYVVFERSPSMVSSHITSDFQLHNPIGQQSNQLYSTYNTSYLIQSNGQVPSIGNTRTISQYFLCNS